MSARDLPSYLTPDEAQRIISGMRTPRDRLIAWTLWETGARLSECLALQSDWIGFDYLWLPTLKRRRIPPDLRQVFVSEQLCLNLGRWCDLSGAVGRTLVFRNRRGERIDRSIVWRLIKRAADDADILRPRQGQLTPAWPHLFRHGRARELVRHTGDLQVAQHQLGHAQVDTTAQYGKPSSEDIRQVMSRVWAHTEGSAH